MVTLKLPCYCFITGLTLTHWTRMSGGVAEQL